MDTWTDDIVEDNDEELKDFQFGGRDAVIFLLDSSPSMHLQNPDGSSSPFEMAIKAITSTYRSKVFASPNDYIGVLLYGTQNNVGVQNFEHLSILTPLQVPEADTIIKLEDLNKESFVNEFGDPNSDFCIHEALWQCQSLFSDITTKLSQKTIILMTCNDEPHTDEDKKKRQSMEKAKDLNGNHIRLEVVPLTTQDGQFRMNAFFKDMIQIANDVDYFNDDDSSNIPVNKYEDLTKVIRKRVHKKRSVAKVYLNLGGDVNLSVGVYNLVQKSTKPSKVKLSKDTNEEVKIQRNFINPDTGAPLLPSEVNKFQIYGGKKIKFTVDEVKHISLLDGKLGLKLIGFKPISYLKWNHYVRPGSFIYPEEKLIKGSRQLFAALLIKCSQKKVMAICSYKARDSTGPSFVALVPQLEEKDENGRQTKPPGFQMIYLPFADDLRSIPSVKLSEPEPDQLDAAKKVIRKLTIREYDPMAFENPDLQSHYGLIEALALQRETINAVDDSTQPPLEIQERKLKQAGPSFIETVYPEGYNPEATTKRKAPALKVSANESKKAKLEDGPIDMKAKVQEKSVEKLTVAQLKEWLPTINVKVTGKKKADLVSDVYNYFN